jgi:aspartate kinase
MPLLVMKFGGTSVATLDRIRRAAKRVGVEVAKGYDVIVIVSAMAGKTNELVGLGRTRPRRFTTRANTMPWSPRART